MLNKQPSVGIELGKDVRDIEVTKFTFIGYDTKRDAIVQLMPFLGYGKFKVKIINFVLWFL